MDNHPEVGEPWQYPNQKLDCHDAVHCHIR